MRAPPSPTPRADLQVCAECDALYARPALAVDAVARCRRCGATLGRGHWLAADGQLALSVAAALVYAIATLSPIVTLELRGVHAVATMLEATRLTWDAGEHLVAVLAAATVIVLPLLVILLRVWVLAPWVAGQRTPALVPALHALRWDDALEHGRGLHAGRAHRGGAQRWRDQRRAGSWHLCLRHIGRAAGGGAGHGPGSLVAADSTAAVMTDPAKAKAHSSAIAAGCAPACLR